MSENINSTNYYILSPEPYCLNDKLNGIDYPDLPYGTAYIDYDSCGSSNYGIQMRYCGLDGWTDVYELCTSSKDNFSYKPPNELIQKLNDEKLFIEKQFRGKINDYQSLMKYKDILDHTRMLERVYFTDKNISTHKENIENYQNSEELDNFLNNVCSFQYGPFTKTVTPEHDVIYSMIDSNEKYIYFKCIRDHGSNKIDIVYENDSNILSVNVDCENDDWTRANSNNSFIYKHTCSNQDKIIYGFCENNEIIFTNGTCEKTEEEETEKLKNIDESSGISWWIWLIIVIIVIIIISVIIYFVYTKKQKISSNKNI